MRGSHRWVAEEIAAREPAGVRHQDLNSWAIRTVTEASARGQLPLAYAAEAKNDEQRENLNRRLGVIEQIVGRAGSVVGAEGSFLHFHTFRSSNAQCKKKTSSRGRTKNTKKKKGKKQSPTIQQFHFV